MGAVPGTGVHVAPQEPALAAWGDVLTCYTAAAASWLRPGVDRWWRPLLAGGPVLSLYRRDDLFLFQHHAQPLAAALSLVPRSAEAWSDAHPAIEQELRDHGRVIVAGDAFRLPWLPGYERMHSPHWFVVFLVDGGYLVEDPLAMTSEAGRQDPVRAEIEPAALADLCVSLPEYPPVAALREIAALGTDDAGLAARYRWLAVDAPVPGPEAGPAPASEPARPGSGTDPETDTGATGRSLSLLADHFEQRRGDPAAHAQDDDVWQACRLRALMVRALDVDRDALAAPQRAAWQDAAALWSSVPPLLLYTRLMAQEGRSGRSTDKLADRLRQLAEIEDRLSAYRFPDSWPVQA